MFDAQPLPIGRNHSRPSAYASRSVWFAATDADQLLLQTIDHLLEAGDYSSFSDLCKQALRSWLLPDEPQPDPTLALLQQQVVALQLQVSQLSQQLAQAPPNPPPTNPPIALEEQIAALIERVTRLEQDRVFAAGAIQAAAQPISEGRSARLISENLSSPSSSAMPPQESDPLLDRLVALLEDF